MFVHAVYFWLKKDLSSDQRNQFIAGLRSLGPVWSRHYSESPDEADCVMLGQALETIGVARMIVGHTVHTEGIRSACDDRVWMVDVGMAAHYGGPVEVLEIRGAQVSVLR